MEKSYKVIPVSGMTFFMPKYLLNDVILWSTGDFAWQSPPFAIIGNGAIWIGDFSSGCVIDCGDAA